MFNRSYFDRVLKKKSFICQIINSLHHFMFTPLHRLIPQSHPLKSSRIAASNKQFSVFLNFASEKLGIGIANTSNPSLSKVARYIRVNCVVKYEWFILPFAGDRAGICLKKIFSTKTKGQKRYLIES